MLLLSLYLPASFSVAGRRNRTRAAAIASGERHLIRVYVTPSDYYVNIVVGRPFTVLRSNIARVVFRERLALARNTDEYNFVIIIIIIINLIFIVNNSNSGATYTSYSLFRLTYLIRPPAVPYVGHIKEY
jgi:hypothetical protein